MKRLSRGLLSGLALVLIVGCRTPEERVVDAMDSVDKAMDKMERKLEAMEKDMRKRDSAR
jgi:hypothetical protein